MKFLIISDIHGSAASLETAIESFKNDFDYIIICGDYLNHGPRNPLPEGWDPKKTAAILNEHIRQIICVRGNCDSEVDEMVLDFPCLNAYTNMFFMQKESEILNGRIFIHHGHLYDRQKLKSMLPEGTLVISGHTHITVMEKDEGLYFFNPGSISLPKCDDGKTCGILETDGSGIKSLSLFSIEGKLLKKEQF